MRGRCYRCDARLPKGGGECTCRTVAQLELEAMRNRPRIEPIKIMIPPPSIIAAETTDEPAGTPHVDEMPDEPYLYHYAIVVLRPDQLAIIATAVADELERRHIA